MKTRQPISYPPAKLLQLRRTSFTSGLNEHVRTLLHDDNELVDILPRPLEKPFSRKLDRIPEETKENSGDSDDCAPTKRGPFRSVRQLDGTDSEWKYRGRTESEEAEPQPLSAPPGLAAQQDEGFQRFYRAVVSPTHVRVTAGGRIVPNNRGPPSPTSKWSKEKVRYEAYPAQQLPPQTLPEQQAFALPPGAMGPYPTMFPGMMPGINPSMAAGTSPYPLMPWHLGMNMSSHYGFPMAAGNPMPSAVSSSAVKEGSRGDKKLDSSASDKSGVPQASYSEQYDHSRQGFYNGQWMMPPTGPFYPWPLPPPHAFPAASFTVPLMPHPALQMNPGMRLPTRSQEQSTENSAQGSTNAAATQAPPAYAQPAKPPMSSIRPSEITRRHLDILRARLKYLEDQLSYNKHQIDEKSVEHDAQMVRQYIEQFEKNFAVQMSIEEAHYPRSDHKHEFESGSLSNGLSDPKVSSLGERGNPSRQVSDDVEQAVPSRAQGNKPLREKPTTLSNDELQSVKLGPTFAGWKPPTTPLNGSSQVSAKSTLPFGAALAAPFQPRPELSLQPPQYLNSSIIYNNTMEPQRRIVANPGEGMEGWAGPEHGISQNTPYLVGYLPYGVQAHLAKDTDYMYGRPLNEDELRARHMYWGKAPQHLQKGLPKFNGKDFFPPSPVKERPSEETASPVFSVRELPLANTSIDCDQSTKASSDPFQGLGEAGSIPKRDGPGQCTQSESLPRGDEDFMQNGAAKGSRETPRGTRVGRSLDDLNRSSEESTETASDSGRDKSSSNEAEEDREVIFTGRRTMTKPGKTANEIWSSMLKKGSPSAHAATGAVSSTTVQGVLPHYSGHATASLTPAIVNQALPTRNTLSKTGELVDVKTLGRTTETRGEENCPPSESGIDDIL